MADEMPDVIDRYFDLDAARDTDAIVALFSEDAILIDEGKTRRGVDAIRDWRIGPASEYEYTTTITSRQALGGDQYRVSGRIDGNFPGGTAALNFDFTIDDGHISRLKIAP